MCEKAPNDDGVVGGNQANILLPVQERRHPSGILQFFTTRGLDGDGPETLAGAGPYDRFNLAGHVGDDPSHVAANRARLLQHLPPPAKTLCLVNQVHGRDTWIVRDHDGPEVDADALVTDQPGRVLGILTADCVPVLMADAEARVIGAAHAGWRGALDGILDSCLEAMEKIGARRNRINVTIGPCIRPPFYLVDPSFLDRFLLEPGNKIGIESQRFFSEGSEQGKLCFDLPGYVRARLRLLGHPPERVQDVERCTYRSESTFFSHRRAFQRRAVPCGRQMSGICLL